MELKKAIAKAMAGEIEGRELYKVASERTDDSKAKKVFNYLSGEENKHYEALKTIYNSLESGTEIEIPEIEKLVNLDDPVSPIFSPEFKERIKDKHFEYSALAIGLKLELDAYRFYKKLFWETEDEELKIFFDYLSKWEMEHYNALQRELDYLKEDYFSANDFQPF